MGELKKCTEDEFTLDGGFGDIFKFLVTCVFLKVAQIYMQRIGS